MAYPEGELEVADLVVEVDARRTPHHDFLGLVALEQLDGAAAHAAGRGGIPLLVMDDAAAVGRTADGDIVEPQAIEDRRDGLNQMRGAQDVASQVEHDGVRLGIARRRREPPGALLGPRGEVVQRRDLAKVPLVVVRHVVHASGTKS